MTIDEYLNQLRKLRRREKRTYQKMQNQYDRATSLQSSFNFGMPRNRSNENRTETRLLDLADTQREWREANAAYIGFREQLQSDIYNLLYWEGLLIEQVYIFNLINESEDDLNGAAEILNTNNRGTIIRKLNEAKAHLRQILIDRGVEIE